MKPHYFFFSILFFSFFSVNAQQNQQSFSSDKDLAIDLMVFHSPILNRNFVGFAADVKYYVEPNWGTGFSFSIANKKISTDFGVGAAEPDVSYIGIGWLNQWDVVQSESARVGFNLNNGLAIVNLRDLSETEVVWDEFGPSEVPVSRARSFFYVVEPGITASFRLVKTKNTPNIFLTTQAKYRKAFGNPEFGKSQDFSGYFVGVGVSFIGLFDSL
jgi:hypothetical protein